MKIAVEGSPEPLELAGDDAVRPFSVEALDVRGRAVQLGPALDDILSRHAYPPAVSRVLAEAVVMTVLLGSLIRTEGKLIFQAQTDGAVDLLVVDCRAGGAVRGYARFDADRVAAAVADRKADTGTLLGKGTIAMTIDGGSGGARYQGIVPLDGGDLEKAAHTYFRQSEQIPTSVRLAVAEMQTRESGKVRTRWRAGGVIVQFLPDALERMRQPDLPGGDPPAGMPVPPQDTVVEDDAWREARAYVETIEDDELIDPAVPVERLLYRLFHLRGVRVFHPAPIRSECSCSRDKVRNVLASFSPGEIEDSTEDGAINVTCEFCGTKYSFDPKEFAH